jgi:hypothetical protein
VKDVGEIPATSSLSCRFRTVAAPIGASASITGSGNSACAGSRFSVNRCRATSAMQESFLLRRCAPRSTDDGAI